MKPLPEGYYREPVVAWVISTENTKENKSMVMFENGIVPSTDGGDVIFVEGAYDHTPLKTIIIPAPPSCFKIFIEKPDGEIVPFCYEVDGVFTSYALNKLMGEQ